MSRILNLAHTAISGSLIVISFGGFAFFGTQFWGLIQHIKKTVPQPAPADAAPSKLA
jgi:hypothetical protein